MALDTLWPDHAPEQATPPLFIISHSCMRPRRTANQKEESMSPLSHSEIIGIDVSRDWLDIHCLSDSRQLCLPNTDAGHAELERMASDRTALVCFGSVNEPVVSRRRRRANPSASSQPGRNFDARSRHAARGSGRTSSVPAAAAFREYCRSNLR